MENLFILGGESEGRRKENPQRAERVKGIFFPSLEINMKSGEMIFAGKWKSLGGEKGEIFSISLFFL